VSDCTSSATVRINKQFGARAEPPPSRRRTGRSSSLAGAELPCQEQKFFGTADRHEEGDPPQSAILQGLGGGYLLPVKARTVSADQISPSSLVLHLRGQIINRTNSSTVVQAMVLSEQPLLPDLISTLRA
jgi:hypothetical protein